MLLGNKPGEIKIKVSGVKEKLTAGIEKNGDIFAQMPIYSNLSKITKDKENYLVKMKGIVFYLDFGSKTFDKISEEEQKEKALSLIKKKGLDIYPAAGVIYTKQKKSNWKILPIVYVKKINTLFLETACGSGSTALGLTLALINKKSINISVLQPSKQIIKVNIRFDGKKFKYAEIKGKVKILLKDQIINY
ncbi:hypothetical protein KJ909_03090 [Patescibacteria group bacterium]|nr:hypothetical protein [Patescibacteria group bacterium]